ncbi:hypothetical protein GW17_00054999 [Ensete ventricosum]|nr:hypothetical protein GW17_00054999 [Ensete ventricosum]
MCRNVVSKDLVFLSRPRSSRESLLGATRPSPHLSLLAFRSHRPPIHAHMYPRIYRPGRPPSSRCSAGSGHHKRLLDLILPCICEAKKCAVKPCGVCSEKNNS